MSRRMIWSNRRGWTKVEEEKLCKLFSVTKTAEIAPRFNRTVSAIQTKAREMGLSKAISWKTRKPWPPEHEQILKTQYATIPAKVLAQKIGRTVEEVKDRARLLHLKSLPRKDKKRTLYHYDGRPKFIVQPNGCWEWIAAKNAKGYPLDKGRNTTLAHRQIYIDTHGSIPDGFDVDHLCRNRACVRVEHLEAVMHRVNVQRGLKAKLTRAEVEEIRANNLSTLSQMAREYGVAPSTIGFVRSGATWNN